MNVYAGTLGGADAKVTFEISVFDRFDVDESILKA